MVTVSGPGMSTMTSSMVKVGGTWQGTIGQIPAGANRNFVGQARNASNTVIYSSSLSGTQIRANQTAVVNLLLQEVAPPPPFSNVAPQITGVFISSANIGPGDAVQLSFTAVDRNGDPITYAWQNDGGTLATVAANGTWTAPTVEGDYKLTALN